MSESLFDVKMFGAVGDGKTDDTDAFQRALDAIAGLSTAHSPAGDVAGLFERVTDPVGPILFIPFGVYRLSRTLHIVRQMVLQGEGGVGGCGGGSRLHFEIALPDGVATAPVTGIVIHMPRTALDLDPTAPAGRGDGTVVRDLGLVGNHPVPTSSTPCVPPGPLLPDGSVDLAVPLDAEPGHGIVMFGRAYIERCTISNFAIDAIHIATDEAGLKNANVWQVRSCVLNNNGRHGLYVQGEDANAGMAAGVDANNNCGVGFFDRSFLGNTYVGCQAAENRAGSYNTAATVGAISKSVFVGCYAEGDNPADLAAGSVVVGGVLAGEVTVGSRATILDSGLLTPITIPSHRLGGGSAKTVVANFGGESSGFGEVFGFQSIDDNPGLDHPDRSDLQAPANRYTLRYEGQQAARDTGWWELTYAASPQIMPLAISGPIAKSGSGDLLGLGWLRLGPIDGSVQIGGKTPLVTLPATLSVQGPIATAVRKVPNDTTPGPLFSLAEDDSVLLVDASTSASFMIVVLPTPAGRAGRRYSIKKIDATPKAVHVEIGVESRIDNQTTFDLTDPFGVIEVVSDGSQWWIVGRYQQPA